MDRRSFLLSLATLALVGPALAQTALPSLSVREAHEAGHEAPDDAR